MQRAVFLDRDGVINRAYIRDGKPYPPCNPVELEILPGVVQALKELRQAGFLLIVVTNQPDVARGKISRIEAEVINQAILNQVYVDHIYACYHDTDDHCDCRKPNPGSLLKAAKKFDIDLSRSYMIGDRWRDVEAGFRAGCRTIFIDYGYAEKQPEAFDYRVISLKEASIIILGESL